MLSSGTKCILELQCGKTLKTIHEGLLIRVNVRPAPNSPRRGVIIDYDPNTRHPITKNPQPARNSMREDFVVVKASVSGYSEGVKHNSPQPGSGDKAAII